MNGLKTTQWILASALVIRAGVARGDTYGPAADKIEFDRTNCVFAVVENSLGGNDIEDRRSRVTVFVRPRLEAIPAAALRNTTAGAMPSGNIRTVRMLELDYNPGLIRVSREHLVLLDVFGTNRRELESRPAISVLEHNGGGVSLRVEDVFRDGMVKYHNGRGRVAWLRDAWFDPDAKRLIVVSNWNNRNEAGYEMALVDLKSGAVSLASREAVAQQLRDVEPRFLHTALDVAFANGVAGVRDVASAVFENRAQPLPARARAAAILAKDGDQVAVKFLDRLASLRGAVPEAIVLEKYDVDPILYWDSEYWLDTIGFAAAERER